jgi:hypothetical protein
VSRSARGGRAHGQFLGRLADILKCLQEFPPIRLALASARCSPTNINKPLENGRSTAAWTGECIDRRRLWLRMLNRVLTTSPSPSTRASEGTKDDLAATTLPHKCKH